MAGDTIAWPGSWNARVETEAELLQALHSSLPAPRRTVDAMWTADSMSLCLHVPIMTNYALNWEDANPIPKLPLSHKQEKKLHSKFEGCLGYIRAGLAPPRSIHTRFVTFNLVRTNFSRMLSQTTEHCFLHKQIRRWRPSVLACDINIRRKDKDNVKQVNHTNPWYHSLIDERKWIPIMEIWDTDEEILVTGS